MERPEWVRDIDTAYWDATLDQVPDSWPFDPRPVTDHLLKDHIVYVRLPVDQHEEG